MWSLLVGVGLNIWINTSVFALSKKLAERVPAPAPVKLAIRLTLMGVGTYIFAVPF
jgi:hypothetical protein